MRICLGVLILLLGKGVWAEPNALFRSHESTRLITFQNQSTRNNRGHKLSNGWTLYRSRRGGIFLIKGEQRFRLSRSQSTAYLIGLEYKHLLKVPDGTVAIINYGAEAEHVLILTSDNVIHGLISNGRIQLLCDQCGKTDLVGVQMDCATCAHCRGLFVETRPDPNADKPENARFRDDLPELGTTRGRSPQQYQRLQNLDD